MYPWNVLQIEPTEDKKAIKKAYAVLLRKHRPDTDPEGFQEINEAYQYALKAESGAPPANHNLSVQKQTGSPNLTKDLPQSQPVDSAASTTQPSTTDPNLERDEETDQLVQTILQQFKATAFAPILYKMEISNWQFLEQFQDISDFEAREALSDEIFKSIVEYNHFQLQSGHVEAIDAAVVNYCNEVMGWEANWVLFEERFPPAYFQHVYHKIELYQTQTKSKQPANWWQRMLSFWFDCFVALVGSILLGAFLFPQDDMGWLFADSKRFITVIFYVTFVCALQMSPFRKSPGQHINDIKIFDLFGNYPVSQMMWVRNAVFHGSMSPLYVWFLWPDGPMWIIGGAGLLSALSNLFSWVVHKQWLHEWLSGTLAIK